jgi:hypothetical protein
MINSEDIKQPSIAYRIPLVFILQQELSSTHTSSEVGSFFTGIKLSRFSCWKALFVRFNNKGKKFACYIKILKII